MITSLRSSQLFNKFSSSASYKHVQKTTWRICLLLLGCMSISVEVIGEFLLIKTSRASTNCHNNPKFSHSV